MVRYIRGAASLESTVAAIQRATRRYARRQLTWYRHQLPADTVRLDGTRPADVLASSIVEAWQQEEKGT
jgi:tRNA dimethylallyltransferase